MITVEEALEKILGYVSVLPGEKKPVPESMGQVLDEDIYAGIQIPALDNSAMDGYAVQRESILEASQSKPVILKVIGTVAAGNLPDRSVEPGTAIRIMTGAPVPDGTDTVIPFEDTDDADRENDNLEVGILKVPKKGANIRLAGEDINKGDLVLEKGTLIRPAQIGMLTSLGLTHVQVIRRPVISILSTGDELVEAGQPLPPGKLYNSNSNIMAALVQQYGGIPQILGVSGDTRESVVENINRGLNCDIFISTAGVSMGDYDVVKDVLSQLGEISFWKVNMKPGKPLAFGILEDKNGRQIPMLGLPGNPASAMVSFEQFCRPSILKMLGKTNWNKPTVTAVMDDAVNDLDGRRTFARVTVRKEADGYHANLTGAQGSGILTSMVLADGLAVIPEDTPVVHTGDTLQVQLLHWNEE